MAKVRIIPRARLDAWVVSDELTITKDWTTVADDLAAELVGSLYQGKPVIEAEQPVEESDEDFPTFLTDTEPEQEDESDGS